MSNKTANTGTVRICRLQNIGRIKADVKIAAVYNMDKPIDGVLTAPELAATDGMLAIKTAAKQGKTWNADTFMDTYVPMYLERLCSPESRKMLNRIYKNVKQGKTVAIGCYCANEATCHRSVIAGLFQGLGVDVAGVKGDYSAFYAMWEKVSGKAKAETDAAA